MKNLEAKLENQEDEIAQMKKRKKTGLSVKGSTETSTMVFSATIVPVITIYVTRQRSVLLLVPNLRGVLQTPLHVIRIFFYILYTVLGELRELSTTCRC